MFRRLRVWYNNWLVRLRFLITIKHGDAYLIITGDGLTRLRNLETKTQLTGGEIVRQALELYEIHADEYYKGTLFFKQTLNGEVGKFQIFSGDDNDQICEDEDADMYDGDQAEEEERGG